MADGFAVSGAREEVSAGMVESSAIQKREARKAALALTSLMGEEVLVEVGWTAKAGWTASVLAGAEPILRIALGGTAPVARKRIRALAKDVGFVADLQERLASVAKAAMERMLDRLGVAAAERDWYFRIATPAEAWTRLKALAREREDRAAWVECGERSERARRVWDR
jgi:hypothetical protein